jgi:GTP-binding protein
MLEFLRAYRRPALVLLTKSDKLSRSEAGKVLARVRKELSTTPLDTAALFSATSGAGVEAAREKIGAWLKLPVQQIAGSDSSRTPRA